MMGLLIAAAGGAGACLPPPGIACGDRWCPEGYLCTPVGRVGDVRQLTCVVSAFCGDGIVNVGEQCDDGDSVNGDGCEDNCTFTGCGDGIVNFGEQCDDNNFVNDDGCDNNCTFTGCGNQIVNVDEQCDDGNFVNSDSCDNNCMSTSVATASALDETGSSP
jgi:cysteine-rich repeat protein